MLGNVLGAMATSSGAAVALVVAGGEVWMGVLVYCGLGSLVLCAFSLMGAARLQG